MNTEGVMGTPAARSRQRAALPRFHLQLTAAERTLLLVLGDLIGVNGSLLLASVLWNEFPFSVANVFSVAKWFVTLSALWCLVAVVLDIYDLPRAAGHSIAGNAAVAALLTPLIYVFVPWFTPPILARLYVFGFVGFSFVSILLWRQLYARTLAQSTFLCRVVMVGPPGGGRSLLRGLVPASGAPKDPLLRRTGYEFVGLVAEPAAVGPAEEALWLGDFRDLIGIIRQYQIDEVVVATSPGEPLAPALYETLLDCRELGLRVTSLAAFHEAVSARLPVDYACYDPAIVINPTDNAAARLYLAAKRVMDLVFAFFGLVVVALLAPFIALGNALTSPGPLFYRQERVGRGGCPFQVIKFRSMRVDAEDAGGAVWCGDRDPRITPLGRWLRRLRLDELPQFINVLRGEMSLVGPRPERPHFVGQLTSHLPLYRARHAVKPGITGWAQTHYGYGNSVEDARIKLEYDLYYVKHAGLALDFLVTLQTIAVMLQLKGK